LEKRFLFLTLKKFNKGKKSLKKGNIKKEKKTSSFEIQKTE
jgi:hypothetical protein